MNEFFTKGVGRHSFFHVSAIERGALHVAESMPRRGYQSRTADDGRCSRYRGAVKTQNDYCV